jgi:hypothetical protein
LATDLKRCSYYETCATYGLNVERVFQDGEYYYLETFLFFIPFPVTSVSVLAVRLSLELFTSHIVSSYIAVICRAWRLHTWSDCIALCHDILYYTVSGVVLCYDNMKYCFYFLCLHYVAFVYK